MDPHRPTFEGWCILELMGHRKLGGFVREETIAGRAFLRIDVPNATEGTAATQYYSPGAVYALMPTTEEIARVIGDLYRPEPATRWELAPRVVPRIVEAPYDEDVEMGRR